MNHFKYLSHWILAGALSLASAGVAAVPGTLTTDWIGNTFGFGTMIDPKGNPHGYPDPTPGAVPEPTSLALLGFGLAGLGFAARKSHKSRN